MATPQRRHFDSILVVNFRNDCLLVLTKERNNNSLTRSCLGYSSLKTFLDGGIQEAYQNFGKNYIR